MLSHLSTAKAQLALLFNWPLFSSPHCHKNSFFSQNPIPMKRLFTESGSDTFLHLFRAYSTVIFPFISYEKFLLTCVHFSLGKASCQVKDKRPGLLPWFLYDHGYITYSYGLQFSHQENHTFRCARWPRVPTPSMILWWTYSICTIDCYVFGEGIKCSKAHCQKHLTLFRHFRY